MSLTEFMSSATPPGSQGAVELSAINTCPRDDSPAKVSESRDAIGDANGIAEPAFERTKLTIAYRDVSLTVRVPVTDAGISTVLSPLVTLAQTVTHCGSNLRSRDFHRLDNASGILRHGTMTLILAPPGHGKSTFLKVMSSRLSASTGTIVYNGLTSDEAARDGCNTRRLTQYVDQIDEHLPLLTVTETLDFAHRVTCAHYDSARVENTIKLLGLEECKDTIIGNAVVRGVSGGQRRRATLGEMLVGDACALFLDEYTNGLDSATAEDITRGLRKWVETNDGLIVTSLQQPTPGLFALFDRIVVLKDSQVIYDGPREDMEPFFASMGFNCPEDVDICDFIIDCVSQPRVALERLQQNERRAARGHGGLASAMSGVTIMDPGGVKIPTETAALVGAAKQPSAPMTFPSSCGELHRSLAPCLTADQMRAHFMSSAVWRVTERALDAIIPPTGKTSTECAALVQQYQCEPLMPSPETRQMYKTGYSLPLQTLFWIVLGRQWKNLRRNTSILYPRLVQALILGLMFGTLYWQVEDSDFLLRIAAIIIPLSELGFGSMAEIASTVDANLVVLKQSAASFYPTWAFVLSATVCGLPTVLFEALALVAVYFMSGAVELAGPFFVYYAMTVCATVMIGVWFRMLTACVNEEAAAHGIAGPSTGMFVMLSGFYITISNMPKALRWLMWVSPYSWVVRALANNEFLSSRYDELADSGVRLGDMYLRTIDQEIGHLWIGLGFLYVIGFSCVCMSLHAFFLNRSDHESSRGTTRFADEAEMLDNETDKEIDADNEACAADPAIGSPLPPVDAEAPHALASHAGTVRLNGSDGRELGGGNASVVVNTLQTLREAVPFSPIWMTFSDVTYTVKVTQRDGTTTDRPLLRNVSGYAEPGKMTALMGASGAGKTTLLDVLAGRKNTGVVEGKIMLNGRVPSKTEFARVTGYVEQFDSLIPTDTVRETLEFAAHLRLPASVSAEVKDRIVEEVLDILDLCSISGHMLGSPQNPGLSPSQLKRVSIGCELVANPAVLFLDEPTTGLDSRAAQTVMRVVRRIARSGRSVICTIHQPSAELFYLFDRLVLLASGGHQIFFGDLGTRSKRFVKYLESVPKVQPIPHRINPASWMLEELGVGVSGSKAPKPAVGDSAGANGDADAIEAPVEEEPQADRVARFVNFYKASSIYSAVRSTVTTIEALTEKSVMPAFDDENDDDAGAAVKNEDDAGVLALAPAPEVHLSSDPPAHPEEPRRRNSVSYTAHTSQISRVSHVPLPTSALSLSGLSAPPSVAQQFTLVLARSWRAYFRSASMLLYRWAVMFATALLCCFIYFRITVDTQSAVTSYISALAMIANVCVISCAASAFPGKMSVRPAFYREISSAMYRPYLWFFADLLCDMFWSIWSTLVIHIPIYFMVGLIIEATPFFKYLFALYVYVVLYISIAMAAAASAPNAPTGNLALGALYTLSYAFSGVTIPFPRVPKGWVWLFRFLPASHLTEALVMPQFQSCTPLPECSTAIEVVQGATTTTMPAAAYASEYLGWTLDGYWNAIGWSVLFLAGTWALALFMITKVRFDKR